MPNQKEFSKEFKERALRLEELLTEMLRDSNERDEEKRELERILDMWKLRVLIVDAMIEERDIQEKEASDDTENAESVGPPDCPSCEHGKVLPIAYGIVSPEISQAADDGKVLIGGCPMSSDIPVWACSACEAPLEIAKDNVNAELYRGNCLIEIEEYEEAASVFDNLLELEPDNVAALKGKICAMEDGLTTIKEDEGPKLPSSEEVDSRKQAHQELP